jgi:hypothetical protein
MLAGFANGNPYQLAFEIAQKPKRTSEGLAAGAERLGFRRPQLPQFFEVAIGVARSLPERKPGGSTASEFAIDGFFAVDEPPGVLTGR